MHSRPSKAQAVAVATPCWPAPVSAMMRFFPSFMARSACPKELLILCAPVWANSSRLNHSWAPPKVFVRFFAKYKGVGPPMYSIRRRLSSAVKAGSTFAFSQATLSSSCASMSVSGMYRPPYWPNIHELLATGTALPLPLGAAFCLFEGGSPPLPKAPADKGPPESSFTNAFMAPMPSFEPKAETIFEPTTAPSAYEPISLTWAREETPKPTATEMPLPLVASRTPATTSLTSVFTAVRAPVTPRTLTT
mmetsp:Transcript_24080/g.51145  ORF Transcript_24080/g.51145 Transcript_24080/m.51145 type:complete len:249 (+) Transcript_24080:990-1736(+)